MCVLLLLLLTPMYAVNVSVNHYPEYDHHVVQFYHRAYAPTSNRPCSIYQYSNMAPRLLGQTSIFGHVFIVSKLESLLGIERKKKRKKLQF